MLRPVAVLHWFLVHLSYILCISAEEDMFSTSHLRMAIVFVYKGDLYGELTVDFWKVVTSEASKHCCFIMYHLLILLGRTTESARIKVFEASYSKWKGKFSLPLSSL